MAEAAASRDDPARLIRCFTSVFPQVPSDRIQAASVETVSEWDSLAAVTLVAVIEEEFGLAIDPLDLPELTSFAEFEAYLREHGVLS
jgi:acyl carrier protein